MTENILMFDTSKIEEKLSKSWVDMKDEFIGAGFKIEEDMFGSPRLIVSENKWFFPETLGVVEPLVEVDETYIFHLFRVEDLEIIKSFMKKSKFNWRLEFSKEEI